MEEISIEPEYGETEQIINYKPIIIEQNKIRYILNIENNQDKIIFSINNKEQIPSINYIKTMNFEEIKELNKAFSVLNSFNNFYDYLQTLSNKQKINIKYNKDKITIIFNIEEISKQQEIDLYPTNLDINLNIKEIYQEIFNIKEKIKEIDSLKEECSSLKRKIEENTKEITVLKNENQYLRSKIENKNKDNDFIEPKKDEIIKEINNILQKQLEELKNEIYLNVEKNILEEKKEKIDEIIKYKDGDIKNRFENKLFNIFSDKRQEIPEKDMNELKKLGTAFLIKYKLSPLDASKEFLKANFQINKEIDEISDINNEIKKSNIFVVMDEIMQRKLDINNQTKYLKDFREKYGIEVNEISDKEIIKYMKKNDEKKIIEAVLKKIKYIK